MPPNLTSLLPPVRGAGCSFVDEVESIGNCLLHCRWKPAYPGVIYRIAGGAFGFEPGAAHSASDTLGLVGTLNLDNGVVTAMVTRFGSARGLLFVAPEGDKDGDDK